MLGLAHCKYLIIFVERGIGEKGRGRKGEEGRDGEENQWKGKG